jgi:hypothetical protein
MTACHRVCAGALHNSTINFLAGIINPGCPALAYLHPDVEYDLLRSF